MAQNSTTKNLPMFVQTIGSSVTAGLFRIILVPIDTLKTILQVEGKNGISILNEKFKKGGARVFFHGALATSAATMIGHYPWFVSYNFLKSWMTNYEEKLKQYLRMAFIGFVSSVFSDITSNSLRVVKTTKQTSKEIITYPETLRSILKHDGILGLFGRGLKMRIITNGIQGLFFSVIWKMFEDRS